MTAGRMSPLAGGRHGSPVLSPTASLDRPSASLQRMYSMDLPTLPVGPTVVQHPPGKSAVYSPHPQNIPFACLGEVLQVLPFLAST